MLPAISPWKDETAELKLAKLCNENRLEITFYLFAVYMPLYIFCSFVRKKQEDHQIFPNTDNSSSSNSDYENHFWFLNVVLSGDIQHHQEKNLERNVCFELVS